MEKNRTSKDCVYSHLYKGKPLFRSNMKDSAEEILETTRSRTMERAIEFARGIKNKDQKLELKRSHPISFV